MTPLIRRIATLAVLAPFAGASLLVAPATAAPLSSTTASSFQTITPVPADSIVDGFGVGLHTNQSTGPYTQTTQLAEALSDLGVRHVRDRLYVNSPTQYDRLRTLGEEGIGLNLITGNPLNQGGSPAQLVSTAQAELGAQVESFEGANEWNLTGRTNWADELRTHQRAVYSAVKSNPTYAYTPVLAPALGRREGRADLGDISSISDFGNNHLYPGGKEPTWFMDSELSNEQIVVPGKPTYITETGYHNALQTSSTHLPAPEDVVADYMPRLLLEYYSRGVPRTYFYEFADEGVNTTDHEDNFGLVRMDYSRKPAFDSMQYLLSTMSDPGGSPRLEPLRLSVSADQPVQYLLTRKSDGSYLLALWRRTQAWDFKNRTPMTVSSIPVTVDLADTFGVTVGSVGTQRTVATSASTSSVRLDLGNAMQIVTLTPKPEQPVAITEVGELSGRTMKAWQIAGTATPNSTITAVAEASGRSITGTTKANADGTWQLSLDAWRLPFGPVTLTVRAVSPSSVVSVATTSTVKVRLVSSSRFEPKVGSILSGARADAGPALVGQARRLGTAGDG
ncbi:MAG: hypothetical protein ACK5MT_04545 [Actinomycetales bacterium]